MPQPQTPNSIIETLIARIYGVFAAMGEVCSKERHVSSKYPQRLREEAEARDEAEATIDAKYWYATFEPGKIEARAKALGVRFLSMATGAHRAAILDFIENPDAPTPLNSMHMTWFSGITPDGEFTLSRTHHVNRAVYDWSARHFATALPYEHPSSDAALERLKRHHFPLERTQWNSQKWREFEDTESTQIVSHNPRQPKCRTGGPQP
jgi:hypothetical protein